MCQLSEVPVSLNQELDGATVMQLHSLKYHHTYTESYI